MGCLHLIWSVVVGFLIGLIARAILPGSDRMGFLATVLVGVVGSLVGGVLATIVSRPPPGTRFHRAGFFWSIIGAILVLILWRFLRM